MWGGLTPNELRELARSLGKPSRKVAAHSTRARYVAGRRGEECRRASTIYEHQR
jgi:hypothetical protein